MTALYKDAFYELYAGPGRVLRLVRTALPFESLEEVPRTNEEVNRVVLARQPREPALLVELRAGRGRNDPEFA